MIKFAGAVIIGFAALMATSPAAGADSFTYVTKLDASGVYYKDIFEVIDTGKQSCHYLRKGADPSAIITEIIDLGYAGREASSIITAAVNEMCPDQKPTMLAFIQANQ